MPVWPDDSIKIPFGARANLVAELANIELHHDSFQHPAGDRPELVADYVAYFAIVNMIDLDYFGSGRDLNATAHQASQNSF
jgi:hypothetical protein